MIHEVIKQWHAHMRGELANGLDVLLDDDVVFYSPGGGMGASCCLALPLRLGHSELPLPQEAENKGGGKRESLGLGF